MTLDINCDPRPIAMVTWPDEGRVWVGSGGVTKIVAYYEPGQIAEVPWLAVYKGDVIVTRVNAAHIAEVVYREPKP